MPSYTPRPPGVRLIDPYMDYLTQRIEAYPGLSASRLMREIRAMGYQGGRTVLAGMVSELRPVRQTGFEVRYETAAGKRQGALELAADCKRDPKRIRGRQTPKREPKWASGAIHRWYCTALTRTRWSCLPSIRLCCSRRSGWMSMIQERRIGGFERLFRWSDGWIQCGKTA